MTAENVKRPADLPLDPLPASMRPRPMTAENSPLPASSAESGAASMRPRPMTAENSVEFDLNDRIARTLQ